MFRDRIFSFMIFTLTCFISIGICFIVNLAVTHEITWSTYPLLSIIFGWLVISPSFIKKHGLKISSFALTFLIFPFLFFLEKITPGENWFYPVGLPSAIVGIIAGWIIYFLFSFIKINLWYKSAASVFLLGVIVNPIINRYINLFLDEKQSFLNIFINIFSSIVISALLGILGYKFNKEKSENNKD